MRRTGAFVVIAIGAACAAQGCWAWPVADEEYRNAVPMKEDLEVRIGSSDAALTDPAGLVPISGALDPYVDPSCAGELCQETVDGEPYYVDGDVYELVRDAKWHVNGGLEVMLGWVELIVDTPYAQELSDGYVWGPWAESLARIEFRFTMTKEGAGEFSMVLEGRNVNAPDTDPWTPVVTGDLESGSEPHASKGTIVLDYAAIHAIDTSYPAPEAGRVIYDFDVRELPFYVNATFEGVAVGDADGPAIDAEYGYTREDDGMAGRLEFDVDADLWPADAPDGLYETLFVDARWTADGEGEGGADALGGTLGTPDGGASELALDECWAGQACLFYQTYAVYQAIGTEALPDAIWEQCGSESFCPAF
jgi:hypothetical protein